MLIGIFLVITWIVLLVRYPSKALPISGAALFSLALVALGDLDGHPRSAPPGALGNAHRL